MEPTDEQIKKFWKWCGGEWSGYYIRMPDWAGYFSAPKIDLNNLFKYAVLKLFSWSIGKNWGLQEDFTIKENGIKASVDLHYVDPDKYDQIKSSEAVAEDPALALFWAIWEAIHEHTT